MSDIKQYEPLWGSWYIDEQLGEGSFGKVYKVHKEEFGRVYYAAVKMISIPQSKAELEQAMNEGLDDASARSYFQTFVTDIIQEIDLMSAFKGNTNIVSLEDHEVIEKKGSIGWDILIRMELLTTLSSYMNSNPLMQEDVIQVGIDIARALELCAMKKTIHRDIKPDNIFVSQYGDYKLGDFGIARQIERTMSGLSKKGTYTYMAPEVFKGEEYGPSVDLYSLGIILYRYLNKNRTPFLPAFPDPITPRERDEALRRRMSGEKLPDIPDIDPELNALVLKACAYDREDRFKDATEFRLALEKIAGVVSKAPAPEIPREPVKAGIRKPRAMRDREYDDGKTVGVFAINSKVPEVQEVVENTVEISPKVVNSLAILGAVFSGLLAALCFASGNMATMIAPMPLYAACAVLCVLQFKYAALNLAFMVVLSCYLAFCAFVNISAFDYSLLALTLGMFMVEASRTKKYTFLMSAVLLAFALIFSGLIFRRLSASQSIAFRAYTASSFGVPLVMLTAAIVSALPGYSVIAGAMGLQLFAFISFMLAIMTGSMTLINVTNMNFIAISWLKLAKILGLFMELIAFESMIYVFAAKRVPETLTALHNNSNKALIVMALSVLILAVGLVLLAII